MRLVETTALAIRLLSIYLLFISLSNLISYIARITTLDPYTHYGQSDAYAAGFAFLVLIIAALICFIFPIKIATWLLPRETNPSPVLNGELETIQLAAFTIIGVAIIAFGLPDLISNVILVYVRQNFENQDLSSLYWSYGQIFITLIKISIGSYLTFGASGLVGIIKKLRMAGSNT
jgi:hypothetical protein